jgi:hypothetical protein
VDCAPANRTLASRHNAIAAVPIHRMPSILRPMDRIALPLTL